MKNVLRCARSSTTLAIEMRGWFSALAMLIQTGCGCPANGCKVEPLETSTPGNPDQLSNGDLSFCVNSYCAMGIFGSINPSAYVGLILDGGCISVVVGATSDATQLTFALLDGSGCPPSTLSAGDTVHARMLGADGHVIFDKTHVIELQDQDSCGGPCNRLQLMF
jgi:hypothetical protein